MPTNSDVLGFSNCWYPEGFENAIDIDLDEYTSVKIFSPAYFIASKLEAFKEVVKTIEPVLTLKISFMYLKIVKV